jgi:ubiquinone/menaquinone biosynthesis C-methylase UbiE
VELSDAKAAAIRHWDARPCGAEAAMGAAEGTREFFDLTDRDRYERYAPWLPGIARWDRFTGQDLLEVGCGTGADLARFAAAGARVSGIDLSRRHLELTRSRFDLSGLPVRLERADAERLPYRNSSFDVVYSFGVIHHTSDMAAAVHEIRRVLRPGGFAIIAVYNLLFVNFALTMLALWRTVISSANRSVRVWHASKARPGRVVQWFEQ